MANPSRRSSRKSAASAQQNIRNQTDNPSTPGRTPTKSKKVAPKDELIGKRIATYWPTDRKYYNCRVLDYVTDTKLHKLIYDLDNSVEEVNLAKRRFKEVAPTEDEIKPNSLVGKKVKVKDQVPVAHIDGEEAPREDWTAIVLKRASAAEEDEEDDDDDAGDEKNQEEDAMTFDVIYLADDYIASVDFSVTKYTLLDLRTNEVIKEVDPQQPSTEDASAEVNSAEQPAVNPSTPAKAANSPSEAEKPDGSSGIMDVEGATTTKPEEEKKDEDKITSADVLNVDKPPASKANNTPSSTPAPVDNASSTPASAVVTAKPKQVSDETDKEASDITMKDVTGEKADSTSQAVKAAKEASASLDAVSKEPEGSAPMEVDGMKSGKGGEEVGSSETPKDKGDELTKENLGLLNPNGGSTSENKANGNGIVVDEETKTVSDGENDNWVVGSSDRVSDPKSFEKKFIMHKVGSGEERVAFVESYLSSGIHFIVYHDDKGGQSQLVLTKENCRLLSKQEIEQLERPRGSEEVKPTPQQKGTKRKQANGKDMSSKRQRASEPTSSLPPPGMEIVGKCVTVTWPNNGKRYKCLVIGCQVDAKKTMHKVYYLEDDTTETMDLSTRNWAMNDGGKLPWNSRGLVGKRLYVLWDGEYSDDEVQKKAEEKYGEGETKVAYEAFVVKFLGPNTYRLLYTCDDNLEDRVLDTDGEDWNVIDDDRADIDGLPIIAWTGPTDDDFCDASAEVIDFDDYNDVPHVRSPTASY